jgi:hypothetical protein
VLLAKPICREPRLTRQRQLLSAGRYQRRDESASQPRKRRAGPRLGRPRNLNPKLNPARPRPPYHRPRPSSPGKHLPARLHLNGPLSTLVKRVSRSCACRSLELAPSLPCDQRGVDSTTFFTNSANWRTSSSVVSNEHIQRTTESSSLQT